MYKILVYLKMINGYCNVKNQQRTVIIQFKFYFIIFIQRIKEY